MLQFSKYSHYISIMIILFSCCWHALYSRSLTVQGTVCWSTHVMLRPSPCGIIHLSETRQLLFHSITCTSYNTTTAFHLCVNWVYFCLRGCLLFLSFIKTALAHNVCVTSFRTGSCPAHKPVCFSRRRLLLRRRVASRSAHGGPPVTSSLRHRHGKMSAEDNTAATGGQSDVPNKMRHSASGEGSSLLA